MPAKKTGYKRYFTNFRGATAPRTRNAGIKSTTHQWQSWLPEVYEGTQRRMDRYMHFDQMDTDPEVNTALDIISEYSTNPVEGNLFEIDYMGNDPSPTKSAILQKVLRAWINLNNMDNTLFDLFRQTLKYGDQFYIRDPATWQMYWVDPKDVVRIAYDTGTRDIIAYFVKNIKPSQQHLVATDAIGGDYYKGQYHGQGTPFTTVVGGAVPNPGNMGAPDQTAAPIPAEHMVHISLTKGQDALYPFGSSILEAIFKVYKQKELLEDAVLIYRIQRAPERKIFYVDTGNMVDSRAQAFLEQMKNDIHQKRIPNRSGGTNNVMDSTYNPQSIIEDYWFTTNSEGKGSRVEVLPGGANLGEIDDLRHFTLKLLRGLRVPGTFMPTSEDSQPGLGTSDGRSDRAIIQEHGFSKFCQRLQNLIAPALDAEFKKYLKFRGYTVDSSTFRLRFYEPINFSKYRQIEMQASAISTFMQIMSVPEISARFAMEKWLGLTKDEILRNEMMKAEEMKLIDVVDDKGTPDVSLTDVNVHPGGPGGPPPGGGPPGGPSPDKEGGPEGGPEGGGEPAVSGGGGGPAPEGGAP